MRKVYRTVAAPLALSMALFAGACKAKDAAVQDTALNRDLQLANRDSAAQPALKDVPPAAPAAAPEAAPRSSGTARRPTSGGTRSTEPAPPPAPRTTASGNTETRGTAGTGGTSSSIAAGTLINLTSNDRVCTNTNTAGDKFTATTTADITGPNGVLVPAGSKAIVQVTSVKHSNNSSDPIQMGFAVQYLVVGGKNFPVDGSITDVQVDKVRNSSTGNDAKKVAAGAVIGGIIGQIIGKDTKSTVIGAATGAAAGTAVAMGTADYEGCVPQGGRIQVKLNSPTTIVQ
jgi:hypothetical protein